MIPRIAAYRSAAGPLQHLPGSKALHVEAFH